ncbi:MAG: Sb-PDE family phosphodiesterase [Bacteroidia bacterium]|nr:Sb-PDE family phosphodiesterase [Bacteroidia bacterium]
MIPDANGFKVLKCDFHIHTVFSDGDVWPTVRVQEAWQEGLDAISLTEHLEYTPRKDDVKPDNDRPYEIAKPNAQRQGIILVKGTEITRQTPPGHFNAIFIGDTDDYITVNTRETDREAVRKAEAQNAFIFWNHPGWQPTIAGSYEWLPFIEDLYKNNALHGIEVVNGTGFHMKALDWCVDKNLTVMGTSDIHNLVNLNYDTSRDYVHRTMTLVMARDNTPESIREALDARRTVAWASKYLMGKEENIRHLYNACVEVLPAHHSETNRDGKDIKYYQISNNSDLYFELQRTSGNGPARIVLYPRSSQVISAEAGQPVYDVVTAYVRSNKHLSVSLPLR